MKRIRNADLLDWKNRADHKPLILRGARQVGKTFLVKDFAKNCHLDLVEINLEGSREYHSLFQKQDPELILEQLALIHGRALEPGRTLLFLDEIQACPAAIAGLRFFYEKFPDLHVVAAGSLLDFALRDFVYSMPVGRVEFAYLHPFTFEEFLIGIGETALAAYLKAYALDTKIEEVIHLRLLALLRKYFWVGGMPQAVEACRTSKGPTEILRTQTALVDAFEADFSKYGTRINASHLRRLFQYIPTHIGKKVKYRQIDAEVRSKDLKAALELLEFSRLIHKVKVSSANGLPLGAEEKDAHFKPLFLDIGLMNRLAGWVPAVDEDLTTVHSGALAEQHVGQELRACGPAYESTRLHYWARERRDANAEVDYVWAHQGQIFPIEVKAGKSGSLKSLHVFLQEKKRRLGVRFNSDLPSWGRGLKAGALEYDLISLPLYLAGQLARLLSHAHLAT